MFEKQDNLSHLSVEELEQLLRIKQRQARQERFVRLIEHGASTNMALLSGEDIGLTKSLALSSQSSVGNARGTSLAQAPSQTPWSKAETKDAVPKPNQSKKFRDFLLLVVEIGAVLGLLLVLFGSYLHLQDLNQEFATIQTNVVASLDTRADNPSVWTIDRLPGGHTPPSTPGGSMPEIPPHLQNWVQPSPAIPLPKQTAAKATRIVIPKIGVDAPVIDGVSWEDLKKGVGHLPNSAQPGERGNMYLAAHNDIFGEIFKDLDKLNVGDKFYVYAGPSKYTYIISEKRIIEPTEVDVMLPTTEPVATLQTCYPYLIDTHRLIVVAELVNQ